MGILRTIFALAVVFSHCQWNNSFVFVGGENAVRLFYIASGFLISYVLTGTDAYPSAKRFYISRWLRLWPMYAVVALIVLAFHLVFRTGFFEIYSEIPNSARLLLFVSNVLLFGQDLVLFSGIENGRLLLTGGVLHTDVPLYRGLLVPQAWTLALELMFYVIAPFVLRRRRILLFLLVGSVLVRILLIAAGIGSKDPWTYRFFPTELACFLSGALAHQVLLPLYYKHLGPRINRMALIATMGFATLAVVYFLFPIEQRLGSSLLFLAFLGLTPLGFIFQNSHRFDRWVGDLSYPIYIGHYFVLQAASMVLPRIGITSPLYSALVIVALAVLFAVLLNEVIGKRVEQFRRQFRGRGPSNSGQHEAVAI